MAHPIRPHTTAQPAPEDTMFASTSRREACDAFEKPLLESPTPWPVGAIGSCVAAPSASRCASGSDGAHLVTGATGFVGGALVLELLDRTHSDVVALVRSANAQARFRDSLVAAANAYGRALDPRALERCRVLVGDISRPGCGVGAVAGRVAQVWHCAASLKYENRYRDEIEATNVDGTRAVLALAEQLGASTFNYVSTAYVAGRTEGLIRETVPAGGVETHNVYECSKVEAERIVGAATGFRRVRVFRPSIVVGHRRTLATTAFSGFYGFVRQLVQFRGMVNRTQHGLLARSPMRIRLDPDARLNLVPIDVVAEQLATIGLSDAVDGIYHLTDPAPATVGLAMRTVFDLLGLHPPEFVDGHDQLGWLDRKFDERLDFYGAYIRGHRQFDRSRTDAALAAAGAKVHGLCSAGAHAWPSTPIDDPGAATADGAAAAGEPWTPQRIAALAGWYLGVLELQRQRLPVTR